MTPFPPRSPRVTALPAYPMADVPRRRRALEAQGVDVIDLGAGDADLAPPPRAVARLRAAVEDPAYSRYPFQLGLPSFREAAAGWMRRRFGVAVDPSRELLPLLGSKEGIAHLLVALLGPDDVGILPDPGYRAYLGGTILAGATPHAVPLREEDGFLLPFDRIRGEVVDRARVLVLNYPNNPTAASAPRDYLERAVAFCRRHGLVLVHDHAYSEIAFGGVRPPSVLEIEGAREVAVEFHSLSKTYNMTGWRVAWAAGSAPVLALLEKVKTFVDTGVFLAVQAGAVGALESWEEWVPGNVEAFRSRRDTAVEALRAVGYSVRRPDATMYLWVPVPGGGPSEGFARRALDEAGVVVLPGAALGPGGEGYVRLALTVGEERLREAAHRLRVLAG